MFLDIYSCLLVYIVLDGIVSFETAWRMRLAGANIFVGGTSSVFAPEGTLMERLAAMGRSIAYKETVIKRDEGSDDACRAAT